MTYQQLADKINALTPEQKQMDVTVSLDFSQEAIEVNDLTVIASDDFLADVLDENHPVLTIDF